MLPPSTSSGTSFANSSRQSKDSCLFPSFVTHLMSSVLSILILASAYGLHLRSTSISMVTGMCSLLSLVRHGCSLLPAIGSVLQERTNPMAACGHGQYGWISHGQQRRCYHCHATQSQLPKSSPALSSSFLSSCCFFSWLDATHYISFRSHHSSLFSIQPEVPVCVFAMLVVDALDPAAEPFGGSSALLRARGCGLNESCGSDVGDKLLPELKDNPGTTRGTKLSVLQVMLFQFLVNRGF